MQDGVIFQASPVYLPYSPLVVLDASQGTYFILVVTNGSAFVWGAPVNAVHGQVIWLITRNNSGGVIVGSYHAVFRMQAASMPPTGFERTIPFLFEAPLGQWHDISPSGGVPI